MSNSITRCVGWKHGQKKNWIYDVCPYRVTHGICKMSCVKALEARSGEYDAAREEAMRANGLRFANSSKESNEKRAAEARERDEEILDVIKERTCISRKELSEMFGDVRITRAKERLSKDEKIYFCEKYKLPPSLMKFTNTDDKPRALYIFPAEVLRDV